MRCTKNSLFERRCVRKSHPGYDKCWQHLFNDKERELLSSIYSTPIDEKNYSILDEYVKELVKIGSPEAIETLISYLPFDNPLVIEINLDWLIGVTASDEAVKKIIKSRVKVLEGVLDSNRKLGILHKYIPYVYQYYIRNYLRPSRIDMKKARDFLSYLETEIGEIENDDILSYAKENERAVLRKKLNNIRPPTTPLPTPPSFSPLSDISTPIKIPDDGDGDETDYLSDISS